MQDFQSAVEVGRALTEALEASNTLVIASSDMTHYEPAKAAAAKDQTALKSRNRIRLQRILRNCGELNITACGYAPITALLTYANGVCAKATLLNYRNSGDVSGDHSSVVGYAAVSFKKQA